MTDEQPTCGRGLAEHSVLPEKLADLAAAMAGVLEAHLHSLQQTDPDSRPEHAAYTTLTGDYLAVAGNLQMIAGRMAGYRDLPMAVHDETALGSPEAVQRFATLVQSKHALLDLLHASLEVDEQMLVAMSGEHQS